MRKTEIAIVGAGPAGISAAISAAERGAEVTLIDEQSAAGGHLRWTLANQTGLPAEIDDRRGFEIADVLASNLDSSNVRTEPGTAVWGHFDGNVLGVAGGGSAYELQADRIILATGSTDIVWPFRGWTLPGVMTGRAARIMMHLYRVRPGKRAAIVGSGQEADELDSDLTAAGVDVIARADRADSIAAQGNGAVESVIINGRHHQVDLVVFALGTQPDPQLARQALCEIEYSVDDGCHVPVRNRNLETTTSGVFVVGDAGGRCSTAQAMAEGTVAAEAAVSGAGLEEAIEQLDRLRSSDVARSTTEKQTEPDATAIPDDVQVCRCEQITAAQIRASIAEGTITLNDVKRRTRAGMGVCQGIFCSRTIARMIHVDTGASLSGLIPMTARPPARLISLADLAAIEE